VKIIVQQIGTLLGESHGQEPSGFARRPAQALISGLQSVSLEGPPQPQLPVRGPAKTIFHGCSAGNVTSQRSPSLAANDAPTFQIGSLRTSLLLRHSPYPF
jgi:hypothetical protein